MYDRPQTRLPPTATHVTQRLFIFFFVYFLSFLSGRDNNPGQLLQNKNGQTQSEDCIRIACYCLEHLQNVEIWEIHQIMDYFVLQGFVLVLWLDGSKINLN